jgi:hypothetical protein
VQRAQHQHANREAEETKRYATGNWPQEYPGMLPGSRLFLGHFGNITRVKRLLQ